MIELPISLSDLDAVIKLASVGIRQQPDEVLFALSPLLAKLREAHAALELSQQPAIKSHQTPTIRTAELRYTSDQQPETKKAWTVKYDNDTGPCDDGFSEWYIVTNGSVDFKCDDEEVQAKKLCDLLNKHWDEQ